MGTAEAVCLFLYFSLCLIVHSTLQGERGVVLSLPPRESASIPVKESSADTPLCRFPPSLAYEE